MRRSALFNTLAAVWLLPVAGWAQSWQMTREGELWVRTFNQQGPAESHVRINAHGSVELHGNLAPNFVYTVKIGVRARTAEQARVRLEKLKPTIESQADWLVLTTPGRDAVSSVVMLAPRLVEASVSTSDGAVKADGIDGPLFVDTGADEIRVDRIHGNCTLQTGGGPIEVGRVDGYLHSLTVAGPIRVQTVGGDVDLRTNGGDIEAMTVGGRAHVETGGGTVHIHSAGGPVTAVNGGGPIIVDRANGLVSAHNVAGPVRVGAASGIRCESNGGVQLSNITGAMNVNTSMGSIFANLFGSRLAESLLATANGDITVVIPSNLGVTIRARNQMADTFRRITSEYREIQPYLRGSYLIAEGRINGGGPLLEISTRSGTIFLRR